MLPGYAALPRSRPGPSYTDGVARPLRVGVQLPEVEREVRWGELADIARTAEGVGFDSIWVGDHLLYRHDGRPERGPLDAWSVLAGLAACTSTVEIGPLVSCIGFRLPGIFARTAAAVDDMSGGRLVLGVGCGWNRPEFEAFGIPFDHRVDRFVESFTIVRRLLDGERVTYRGRYASVEDAVLLPPPARRPALMVGSNGARMLAATLPHVDRWNTWWDDYGNSTTGFRSLNRSITEAAEAAGRDPSELFRSACVLVQLEATDERRVPEGITPVSGEEDALLRHLAEMADAGADEAILVLSPITAASVERLGTALAGFG